jgi:CBS domain-containing protein
MTPSAPSGPVPPSSLPRPTSNATARGVAVTVRPSRTAVGQPLYGSLIADVMTRDVVTVGPRETLRSAALLLSHKRISGLPVVDDDRKVVGVLSEKDIARVLHEQGGLTLPGGLFDLLLEPSEARQKDMIARSRRVLETTEVRTAMTSPAQTIAPSTPTVEAIRRMIHARINRLPVVEGGRLVGIVTRRDVLSVYLEPT